MSDIVLAPRIEDYPPLRSISEASLFRAYGLPILVNECACGGVIRSRDSPQAIAYAVEVHTLSTNHVDWACSEGLRDD